ncbi:hypothetical protein ACTRLV_08365 [Corynebacterium durum]|uniref:hypothetical protein n=1 Tax=Corynebacterium durum TaxID=61592 RepID=UPI0015CEECAE|nr:hypothetical protein [Corynebacterium durum]NYI73748.1 hypothetical protein [Corynebacterium durum]WJY85470.1 hypothetical protein CDUR_08710 [Corynebacterium durum]
MKLQRRLAVVVATSMLASGLAVPAVHAADQKPQTNNQVTRSSEGIVDGIKNSIATLFLFRLFGPSVSSCIAGNDASCEFI